MTASSTTSGVATAPAVLAAAGGPRRRRRMTWTRAAPYLLALPAILLELLIPIVPMIVGIGIRFLKLTQFYIRTWSAATRAGFSNYALALDFSSSTGKALLHSFYVTCLYTLLVV